MRIGIIKETSNGEKRVAATPETAGHLAESGIKVCIETGAGNAAGFNDDDFRQKGVDIGCSAAEICRSCDILFKIRAPLPEEWQNLTEMQLVLADFSGSRLPSFPFRAFALEKIPRISRAQNMDILSSQDNLAGYKAAIKAFDALESSVPMMITAAGTLPPMNVFIWGLGVAGLQAAATAKRLGARVYASDIRPETAEQAASVGALFIPEEEVKKRLSDFGLIITAAGSFGEAPILLNNEASALISPQCLIFDISGNVAKGFLHHRLIRCYNPAAEIPASASRLFANNLYNFFGFIYDFEHNRLDIDFDDEIIRAAYLGEKRDV